jgi:hypothetical protein
MEKFAFHNYLSYLCIKVNAIVDMIELWKEVAGFEGIYKVSNTGKVVAHEKTIIRGKGNCLSIRQPEMELKPTKDKWGYYGVNLWKGGKNTRKKVHRLVAEAFLPNPNNLRYINHKDEDKANNSVENLEWCTSSYNNTYGSRVDRMRLAKFKPVEQLTKDGKVVARFESLMQAEAITGIKASNISKVAKGGIYGFNTAGGYKWRFAK